MKSDTKRLALSCGALIVLGQASHASAASYQVTKNSEVSFLAKITASSFITKSAALSGVVDYDDGSGSIKSAAIKVKADSFDTGMSLRNSHMRDNYLEAAKFPDIVFQVEGGKVATTPGSESTIDGFFIIKGVKKPSKLTVKVIEQANGRVGLSSRFKLNITDFGIKQPKFTMVSMEPIIDVTLKLLLETKSH